MAIKSISEVKKIAYIEEIKVKKTKEVFFQAVIEVKGDVGIYNAEGDKAQYLYSPKFDKATKASKFITDFAVAYGEVKVVLSPAEKQKADEEKAKAKAEKDAAKAEKLKAKAEKQESVTAE